MARKVSLREFQQALVRRLNEAQASEAVSARLGVQVGGELWLLRLNEVGEVIPPPAITPGPLTRHWFRGLTNIRGNLYTVVDFSAFLGGEPTPNTADTRLLLVGERYGVNTALLVHRMLGIRHIEQFQQQHSGGERPWEVAHYVDQEGRLWRELEMSALVYHNDFLQSAA